MNGVLPSEALFLIGMLVCAYSLIFMPKLALLPIKLVWNLLDAIFDRVFTRSESHKAVRRNR